MSKIYTRLDTDQAALHACHCHIAIAIAILPLPVTVPVPIWLVSMAFSVQDFAGPPGAS